MAATNPLAETQAVAARVATYSQPQVLWRDPNTGWEYTGWCPCCGEDTWCDGELARDGAAHAPHLPMPTGGRR